MSLHLEYFHLWPLCCALVATVCIAPFYIVFLNAILFVVGVVLHLFDYSWCVWLSKVSSSSGAVAAWVFEGSVCGKQAIDTDEGCRRISIPVLFAHSIGSHAHGKSCILVSFAELAQFGMEITTYKH